jgi:hypothetical protein
MKYFVFTTGIVLLSGASFIRGKLCEDMTMCIRVTNLTAFCGIALLVVSNFLMEN